MSLYLGNNLISGSKPINLGVRNIGELIYSSLPLTDAGLHLLDGSLILGGGIYQGFVDYIADLYGDGTNVPDYFCTEAEWQTAVTTYGVCGKFVYDSVNNTVRLPKITGIVEGTTDTSALGDLVEAGLPNITGGLDFGDRAPVNGWGASGAFYTQTDNYNAYYSNDNTMSNRQKSVDFDASRSSSIYGNSATVQPQTIKCFVYIVIANSTKTDIQVDIDEIAIDLNGKADVDLSNITASQSAKNTIVEWGMPDYANGISLAQSTNSEQQFTIPSDGVIAFRFYQYQASTFNGYVYINNELICGGYSSGSNSGQTLSATALVTKNDIVRYKTNDAGTGYRSLVFYPMKGVN